MTILRTAVLVLLSTLLANTLRAADETAIGAALGREVLKPRQTLAEVQDFIEARVPAMPAVKSAAEWTAAATRLRAEALSKVVFRGEAARWRDAPLHVEWLETIDGGPGYRIKKLRFEALPGLWVPALLYEPETLRGKVPVVLNVNGHDSKGKAADYKQIRCINQAKRGMLALNLEWFGMGQLATAGFSHPRINAIDLCGTGGVAAHYLAMSRVIDILLAHEHADRSRVAVTGLSGGGWQTIFISGLDARVTLTDPVAGYSSFKTRVRNFSDLGDSEQTPSDLATVVDYTHLTAMMAPKPTLLTFNGKDNCCFAAGHALPPLREAAAPIFRLFGLPGNLRAHINEVPGDHNYGLDNRQAFYQMTADFWSTPETVYNPKEIPSDGEVKTPEQLKVELPANNADLRSVAVSLASALPRSGELPKDRKDASLWGLGRRDFLHRTVKLVRGDAEVDVVGDESGDGLKRAWKKYRVGGAWTVPAVELSRDEPKATVVLIADGGRKTTEPLVKEFLDRGRRVVAADLFYFGESKVADHDYLFALAIATVGERPLGVQAGQLLALMRKLKLEHPNLPVTVAGQGPRSSTIALVAAALDDENVIAGLDLRDPLGSLKELIDGEKSYVDCPELYCFGLLEGIDIKQLAAVVAPHPVRLSGLNARARSELAGLKDWYDTLRVEFDPFQ